jgi:predicted HicB family RNase H-like nuclease
MSRDEHYQKIVFWSEEDSCFIGQCPSLFLGGVHGDDEPAVYADLCRAVEEHLEFMAADHKQLPPPDPKEYSGKLTVRITPELHRTLAIRARVSGNSLNGYIERSLADQL